MSLFDGLSTLLVLVASIPVWVYVLEVVAACLPTKRNKEAIPAVRPRLAVIVPAHNEEAGIGGTLASIQPQLLAGDRLLVIADNCSDGTAAAARASQAEVIERTDAHRRGKAFALAYALQHLANDSPEAVVFVDADCRLEANCLTTLAAKAVQLHRPVQALYLCESTAVENVRQAISGFAFRVRNLVRPRGLARFGGPCQLTGSGMAMPWELVDKVNWAGDNLVEDMQLGIDFTLNGFAPQFVPEAVVTSALPESDEAADSQRRRWEHGQLATAMRQAPSLFLTAIERGSWSAALLALDLIVPPLALLSVLSLAVWTVCCATWLLGLGGGAVIAASIALTAFFVANLAAWVKEGREVAPLSVLPSIPRYIVGKIPLYLDFVIRRQREWVRTARG